MPNKRFINLLYIEDDEALSVITQTKLERKGFVVDLANDGEDGFNLLCEKNYDLLLIDYNVPVYNGIEFIQKLLKSNKMLPVIMITGAGDESIALEAIKLGAKDYLVKDMYMNYLKLLPYIIDRVVKGETLLLEKEEILKSAKEHERRFRLLTQTSNDIIFRLGENSDVVFVSPSVYKTLGIEARNIVGKNIYDFIDENDFNYDESFYEYATSKKRIRFKHKMKDYIWLEASAVPYEVAGVSDNEKETLCIFRDISEEIKNADRLKLNAAVFENSGEGIIITDAKGVILSVNNAFVNIMGYRLDELMGKRPSVFRSNKHDDNFYKEMYKRVKNEGVWRGEIIDLNRAGEEVPFHLSISSVLNDQGELANYVGILSDIRDIKKQEEKLKRMALYDTLTELPNRFGLKNYIDIISMQENAFEKSAFLLLDLDNFKIINDSLGHGQGDILLLYVAKRLYDYSENTHFLSRVGGDEFVIVLRNVLDAEEAKAEALKVIRLFEKPFEIGFTEIFLSVSAGLCFFSKEENDLDLLMKNADVAMYEAKENGKNRYALYDEYLYDKNMEKFYLANQLRRALNLNEFFLVFQPKYRAEDLKVLGVEALIRWRHPEKGFISPEKFIGIAEETGLISKIDEWVLYEGLNKIKKLHDKGVMIDLAVNVSLKQFNERGFVELVLDALKNTAVHAEYLEIEITERVIMHDVSSVVSKLQELKDMGVKISIDDFGTGYSSLNYLKKLPINTLKLDKSFIDGVPENEEDDKIIKVLIALAKSFNLNVIAEGVETKKQYDYLVLNNCDEIQGYYLSRPLEFDSLLKEALLLSEV